MQHTRSASLTVTDFTPVPRQPRKDGWTPTRQRAFIAHLAATGSVTAATSSVGLSTTQAYRLRAAPGAGEFASAWDAALDCGIAALKALALDRAVNGVPVTPIWRGEARATYMRHDNRLMMSMLRHYDRPLPAGTVGGKKGGGAAVTIDLATLVTSDFPEQVMPVDLTERLFQNAVVTTLDKGAHLQFKMRALAILKSWRGHQGTIDDVIDSVAEEIVEAEVRYAGLKRDIARGPAGYREDARRCNQASYWRPLSTYALLQAARIRVALGLPSLPLTQGDERTQISPDTTAREHAALEPYRRRLLEKEQTGDAVTG